MPDNAMAQRTAVISYRTPGKVFCYSPLEEAHPETFMLGLKTNLSLESIIMHTRLRGLRIESNWRNKKPDDTISTYISVVDEKLNSAPGATFISMSTNAASVERFFRAVSFELLELANALCIDISTAEHDHPDDREILLREAQFIVVAQNFVPGVVTMDKDLSIVNAVQAVWPAARPIISQAHMLQSVKTPAADDGAEALNRFDFDDDQKKAFGSAVQRFQRVNDNSELIDYKRQFFQDLFNICTKSLGGSGDEELADGVHQAGRPSETDMKKFRYLKMHLQEERMTLQSLPYLGLPETPARDSLYSDKAMQTTFRGFADVTRNQTTDRADQIALRTLYTLDCDKATYDQADQAKSSD